MSPERTLEATFTKADAPMVFAQAFGPLLEDRYDSRNVPFFGEQLRLMTRLRQPPLNSDGWRPSGPGALSRLSKLTSRYISSYVGTSELTLHSVSVNPGNGTFAAG